MNSLLGQPDLARELAAVVVRQRVAAAQADGRARRTRQEQQLQRDGASGARAGVHPRLVRLPARLHLQRS